MMTPEQKDIFIDIAQMGVACGLAHPFEWLTNYIVHLPNLESYEDVPVHIVEAISAFAAFFRGCESGPDDEFNENMTDNDFVKIVNRWYEWRYKKEMYIEPEGK